MRKQPIEVVPRQRGEQFVVQGKTGVRNWCCHCVVPPGRSGRFTAEGWEDAPRGRSAGSPCIGTSKGCCRSGNRHSADSNWARTAMTLELEYLRQSKSIVGTRTWQRLEFSRAYPT